MDSAGGRERRRAERDPERRELLRSLFPCCVATAESTGLDEEAALYPEEEVAIRRAVAKRRREFRGGRACARRALESLGLPPGPLPMGPRRAPVWPEGVVGSITHTRGFCAAAVARRSEIAGLGVDAEQRGAVTPKLGGRVCTEPERAWMERTPPPPGGDWETLLFSAKESLYKAIATAGEIERVPGFDAATIASPPEAGRFRAELLREAWPGWAPSALAGRYVLSARHVVTGVWLAAADGPPAPARPEESDS